MAQWQQVGPGSLTVTTTDNLSIDMDNAGTFYVAYRTFDDNNLYVKKYINGSWEQLGGSASESPVSEGNMIVAEDGFPVVVYRNYNDSITVRKFDGAGWQVVGNGALAKGEYPRLAVNSSNIIHVVCNNLAVYPWGTSVFKFEGGSWSTLHSQYIENVQAGFTDIAFDSNDNAVVSFRRESTGQMSVFKSNGTDWQAVGNTLFTPNNVFFGRLSLDNNDAPYITFAESLLNNAGSVMHYNGSTWEYLGDPGFTVDPVDYTPLVFDDSNTPYLAIQNGTTKLMSFSGTAWQQVGSSPGLGGDHDLIFSSYGIPVLAMTDFFQGSNLFVKQQCSSVSVVQDVTICSGEYFVIGGESYDLTGTYEVTLTQVSGCDSIVTTNLTVLDSIYSEQEIALCSGDSFQVGSSVYNTSGVFMDVFPSVNGCDSSVYTTITVAPPINNAININDNELIAQENSAEYQWIDCSTMMVISGAINQSFTVVENGQYAVEVTMGDCSVTSDCINFNSVGINTGEEPLFSIFPNPSFGQIEITLTTGIQLVEIFDQSGKTVLNKPGNGNQKISISLEKYVEGLYYIKLHSNDRVYVQKVQMQ